MFLLSDGQSVRRCFQPFLLCCPSQESDAWRYFGSRSPVLTDVKSPTQAWSAGCLLDLYMDAAEAQGRSVTADVPARS